MINSSETIGLLGGALAKAQGQMKGAVKDATNPHLKSRYADLASVWDACRDALTGNEIAVIQLPMSDLEQGAVGMSTRLVHSSGEWIESICWTRPKDLSPQSIGSAQTYLRRYGLSSMAGVTSCDDDGEGAQHGTYQAQASASKPQQQARQQAKPQQQQQPKTTPRTPKGIFWATLEAGAGNKLVSLPDAETLGAYWTKAEAAGLGAENAYQFIVDRSNDGITNWNEVIEALQSQINTTEAK